MIINFDDIVKIFIAIGGWLFGFFQLGKKRKYEKQDKKAEAYKHYLQKMDDINLQTRIKGMGIFNVLRDFHKIILCDDKDIIDTIVEYNQKLANVCKETIEPFLIAKNELNQVRLFASDELLLKINEMQTLTQTFADEYCESLKKLKIQNSESFKELEKFGKDERWEEFSRLNDEIVDMMRKEIL